MTTQHEAPSKDALRPEAWIRRCPNCGGDAKIVGGHNTIDYIRCDRCGYYGDHWEEDGIVFDIPVPTVVIGGNSYRRKDEDTYRRRIGEIYQEARARGHLLSSVVRASDDDGEDKS
jgi:ribosomal protein S27AE